MDIADSTRMSHLVRTQACATFGCTNFAELTALVVADRFARTGRSFDALRILRRYLERYPETPKIAEKLRLLTS